MDSQSPFALLLVGQPALACTGRLGLPRAAEQCGHRCADRWCHRWESADDDDYAKKAVTELTRE
jgi:hypothetical protein